jgi:hypothetical protein
MARQRLDERKRADPHPRLLERQGRIALEQVANYLESLRQSSGAVQAEENAPPDDHLLVTRQRLEEAMGRSPMGYQPTGGELTVWADLVSPGRLSPPDPRAVLEALVATAAEETRRTMSLRLSALSEKENEMVMKLADANKVGQLLGMAQDELKQAREDIVEQTRRAQAAEEARDHWEREAKEAEERAKVKPYANGDAPKTAPRKKAETKPRTRKKVPA